MLLALLVLVLPFSCRKLELETDILEAGEGAVCWMSELADDTPLARLSIPGAHDAASATISAWPAWTRTQEKSIAGLWNCGVRAFDLRPALSGGQLGLYHDKYSAGLSLSEALQTLLLALERHPGECAIVLIRHEAEADGNDPRWKDAMGSCLKGIASRLAPYREGITLGELRGRILVLSRQEYTDGPFGGYIRNWSSQPRLAEQKGASVVDGAGNASPLWVQDFYHPEGETDKWAAVQGLWDEMAAQTACPLVINHCSAYVGTLPDYRANARNINARAAAYIASRDTPAGIVMMDFAGISRSRGVPVAGDTLLQALIGHHFEKSDRMHTFVQGEK